jgi:HAD superfamily hydrolase (TIGR01549 family)
MVENIFSQIKAVLLDFDDTIIDLKKASFLSFNYALKKHDLRSVSYKEMLANWEKSRGEYRDLLVAVGEEYHHRFDKIHLQYSTLIPGTVEVLKKLKEMKIMTAIVSRRPRKIIEEELDKFNIKQYIDIIVGREDVTNLKPAPDALILVANMLNVLIEHCLVVGDSPNDIKASKAVRAKSVAVLTGYQSKINILEQKPDIVLNSIADLATF